MPAPGKPGVTIGGLDLSAVNALGVTYLAQTLEGWGAPATTLASQQKPRGHGTWSGESWLQGRTIVVGGVLHGPDPLSVSAAVDDLLAACSLDPTLLVVSESGRDRTCMVRQQDIVQVSWVSEVAAFWSIQVVADDPRKYGTAVTGSTNLPSSSGGLAIPITIPIAINATTVSGLVSITNLGNIAAPVMVRFTGPVTGPKVVHVQTQKVWAAAGAVLGAGEFWTVAMPSRQVLAQGQSSRAGYATQRDAMELLPGPNDFAFSADSYDAASLMTVTAASAWK